jgi:hypothetical protein
MHTSEAAGQYQTRATIGTDTAFSSMAVRLCHYVTGIQPDISIRTLGQARDILTIRRHKYHIGFTDDFDDSLSGRQPGGQRFFIRKAFTAGLKVVQHGQFFGRDRLIVFAAEVRERCFFSRTGHTAIMFPHQLRRLSS